MHESSAESAAPRRSGASLLFFALLSMFVLRLLQIGWILPGERLMPGTKVAGIDVGGMTIRDAREQLETTVPERIIVLSSEDRSTEIVASELGISIDAQVTLDRAFSQGRLPQGRLRSLIPYLPIGVLPEIQFDAGSASNALAEAALILDRPAFPAGLRIDAGRAESIGGQSGAGLSVSESLKRLEVEAAQVLSRGRFRPVTEEIMPSPADASPAAATANRMLVQALQVQAYDPVADQVTRWELPPAIWNRWVDAALDPEAPDAPRWLVDPTRVVEDLASAMMPLGTDLRIDAAEIADALPAGLSDEPPFIRVRAYHRAREHRVVDGDTISGIAARYGLPYPWIAQLNPHAADGLWPDQLLEIPPADTMIPLPPVEGKRIRVDLSEQEMIAYHEGRELWRWPVSTGVSGSPTAPGVYQVRSREIEAFAPSWDLQMPFFVGIYPPLPDEDVMNGFHGFPTQGGGEIIWTDRIGSPATYGCVLLPSDRAEALYTWAELGVVVEIVE